MKKFFAIILQNALAILLMVAVLVAANYLAATTSCRLDFTEEKEYTLSPATKKVLAMLEDRLTVKLYYSKNLPPQFAAVRQQVADLLEELRAHTKQKIIIESIEPDLNEETENDATMAGIVPLEVNTREKDKVQVVKSYMGMVIYYRDRKETIPVLAQVDNLEYSMALSLLKLAGKKTPRIGVMVPSAQESSGNYRYVAEIARLLASALPVEPSEPGLAQKNLSTLIIIEPRGLTKEFLQELDNLVDDGLNVMIFAGSLDVDNGLNVSPIDTGMADWLKGKGFALSEKFVMDVVQNERAAFQEGMMQLVMDYPLWIKSFKNDMDAKHPITAKLEEVLLPWSSIFEEVDLETSPWTETVLVKTSPKSFMQQHDVPNVGRQALQAMVDTPQTASRIVAVLLENKDQPKSGRLLLVSNFQMLRDEFFRQSQSNFVFVQNAMEYLSWGEYVIGIRSRGKTSRPITRQMTPEAVSTLKLVHIIGIPVFAIVLGVLGNLMLRARRRKIFNQLK